MSNIYQLKPKPETTRRRGDALPTIESLLDMDLENSKSGDLARALLRVELANMLTLELIYRIQDDARRSGYLRQSVSIQKAIEIARRNLAGLSKS